MIHLNLKVSNLFRHLSRRNLFKGTSIAALTSILGCGKKESKTEITQRIPLVTYKSIGVKPVINCSGTMTHLGGSLMPSEVVAAMEEAGKHFVPLFELQEAVGSSSEMHTLFLYSMQLSDGQDLGRARRFNTLYAYHRALLVLVALSAVMLGAAMLWGQAAAWPSGGKLAAGVVVLLFVVLIWYRAWQRACYYVREVLLTSERILDGRKQEKE